MDACWWCSRGRQARARPSYTSIRDLLLDDRMPDFLGSTKVGKVREGVICGRMGVPLGLRLGVSFVPLSLPCFSFVLFKSLFVISVCLSLVLS